MCENRLGQQGGKRKTLRAKVLGGSLGNSTSSLAVFYVEQVALNRHVSPQPQLSLLCLIRRGKSIAFVQSWLASFRLARDPSRSVNSVPHAATELAVFDARLYIQVRLLDELA